MKTTGMLRELPSGYRIALAGIVALTLISYAGVIHNGFLVWDDRTYITSNTHIHELSLVNLQWMLLEYRLYNWHPLTWLSHAVDYSLWGPNAGLHHLGSVVLHALNSLLVFVLAAVLLTITEKGGAGGYTPFELSRRTLLPAVIAAGLFAIHPQHVESVAWVAERKDVLCAFFYLLTVLAYLNYCADMTRTGWRVAALVFFLMALMSKPMAISIPVVLLLLDVFPLQRLGTETSWLKGLIRLVAEKLAYIILSVCVVLITLITQDVHPVETMGPGVRILNALNSVFLYIYMWLVPVNFAPFYPYPDFISSINPRSAFAVTFFLAVTVACIHQARRGRPYLLVGWLYFCVTLLPVSGIVKVGEQAAADRYTYLPMISFYIIGGVVLARAARRLWITPAGRAMSLAVMILAGAGLALQTARQVPVWQSDETLWQRVISLYPGQVALAHLNLGNVYAERNALPMAISSYRKGLEIEPSRMRLHHNLALAYERRGETSQAIAQMQKLVELQPDSYWAHIDVGDIHLRHGDYRQAEQHYRQALALDSGTADAHAKLGRVYMQMNRPVDAEKVLKKAIELKPQLTRAHLLLGVLYQSQNINAQAIKHYEIVLTLDAGNVDARHNLAVMQSPRSN